MLPCTKVFHFEWHLQGKKKAGGKKVDRADPLDDGHIFNQDADSPPTAVQGDGRSLSPLNAAPAEHMSVS